MNDEMHIRLYELGYDKCGARWLVRAVKFTPDDGGTILELIEEHDIIKANDFHVLPRAVCKIFKESNNTIAINDIEIIDKSLENRGIGTLLINFVEELARLQGVKKLHGELSSVDSDHFDKLQHFYKKLGFNFLLYKSNKGNMVGQVEKQIP